MYTQCPECRIAFRVTATILQQAEGNVRCGNCNHAFNALHYLSEDMPTQQEADDAPTEDVARDELAETSRRLLETLDELAGPEDVRIEDTGVEWRVLDEAALEESIKVEMPAEEPRYDDNTPLPDDFDDEPHGDAPVPQRREDDYIAAAAELEDRQGDLALSEPEEWTDILEEVTDSAAESIEVEEELAAIHTELAAIEDDLTDEVPAIDEYDVPVDDEPTSVDAQDELEESDGHEPVGREEYEPDLVLADTSAEPDIELDDSVAAPDIELEASDSQPDIQFEDAMSATSAEPGESAFQARVDLESDHVTDFVIHDEGETLTEDDTGTYMDLAEEEEDEPADSIDVEEDVEIEENVDVDVEEDSKVGEDIEVDDVDELVEEIRAEAADIDATDAEDDLEAILASDHVEGENEPVAAGAEDDIDEDIELNGAGPETAREEEAAEDMTARFAALENPEDFFDESSGEVETIIMEGEFVRSEIERERVAAENAARSQLDDPARLADTYALSRGKLRGGRRSYDPPSPRTLAAIASLALLLVAQYVHNSRESLATYGFFNQTIAPVYRVLGSPVTPEWNIKGWQFEATSGSVGEGETTLTIVSRIGNRSDESLPYPLIHLSLTNRYEDIMGSRILEPGEYLDGELDPSQPVPPGENFTAVLEVEGPSPEATGFKLNVCYRARPGSVRCAIEDFKD